MDELTDLLDALRVLPGYVLLASLYYAAVVYPVHWYARRRRASR